jgi:uncharacterized membrane protein
MTKTTKTKVISLLLVISGILVLIVGIGMVQTGFAGLDDTEPTVGLYIGGIFSIIGGIFLTIAGIIIFFDFKKKLIRMVGKVANAVEEERKQEK